MVRRPADRGAGPPRLPRSEPKYDVGYARPPEGKRFAKGVSGNPSGRPRGSRNRSSMSPPVEKLKEIILKEAYRTIRVPDGDRVLSISMAEAVMRSISVSAAKGHARAQRLFTDLLYGTERANAALHAEWLDVAMQYKLDWERTLERRRQQGIVAPDPLPHPDDIIIDVRAGTAKVIGPMTNKEKQMFDQCIENRDELAEDFVRKCHLMNKSRGDRKVRWRGYALHSQHLHDRYNAMLPPRLRKPLPNRLYVTPEEQEFLYEADRRRGQKRRKN
jgi:hypothetical protein